jgi:nicotinamidase-related amidase
MHETHHFTRVFNVEDTAVVLIDHQKGTCGWVHSIDAGQLEKNVKILATFATKMRMPLVLTSSQEDNVQGLLLDVIQEAAPEAYAKRVKRQGIVNAMDDHNFAQAVRATGKKNLIVAGVTTDVCLVPPALSMQHEGFHIKCVLDAGGSPTPMAESISGVRLNQAGVPVTSTNAIISELVKNWVSEAGQVAFPLMA